MAAAACGSSSGSHSAGSAGTGGGSGGSSGDYVIGYTDGLTGPTAAFAAPDAKIVQAAFDAVNAAGGVNGHKVKMITLDQGAPGSGQAAANVTQLVTQDNVSAILGESISNDCASVEAIATQHQVPLLCQRVPTSDLQPVKKYVFIDTSSEIAEVQPMINMIKNTVHKANPRVAVFGNDNIGTNTWAAAMRKAIEAQGWTVSTYQSMAETATSASANIAAIVGSHPDAVVGEIFQQFWPPTMQGLQAAGLNIPVVATDGDVFYSQLTQLKNPNLFVASFAQPLDVNTSNAQQQQLLDQMKTQGWTTNDQVNTGEGTGVTVAAYDVAAALQKCGYPCPGPKLATALEQVSTTAAGLVPAGFGYTASSHFGIKQFFYLHWDPSKSTVASAYTEPPGDPITGAAGS
jgi:branched-chain amino acid transport system substrate-binding protein